MRIQYYSPRDDICEFVSSYYSVIIDEPLSEAMRAEIASVRFLVRGELASDVHGQLETMKSRLAMLCGPTHRATTIEFGGDVQIFGAAVTPLGWARMFEVDASDLADKVVTLDQFLGPEQEKLVKRALNAPDDATRVTTCDHLFASMIDPDRSINESFLESVTSWITAPEGMDLDTLLERTELSPRQVERLCKKYFGCPPKMLHRKFRALDSANRLSWQDLTDWREAAGDHYHDQPHFTREFKHFIGRTPSDFIRNRDMLIRAALRERLEIKHESPLSLIG